MNLRPRYGTLLAIAAVLAIGGAAGLGAQTVSGEAGGIKVSIVLSAETAEITVSAPVSGWVAVGFDPSMLMKGADILIGYVKDGKAFARDDYGVGPTAHAEDASVGGTDNLLAFSGAETGGVTTMVYTISRKSPDAKDAPLGPGKHTVILAAGAADNFSDKHRMRGKVILTLP
jgi:hypothetical protein